jgi:hypothetical protein
MITDFDSHTFVALGIIFSFFFFNSKKVLLVKSKGKIMLKWINDNLLILISILGIVVTIVIALIKGISMLSKKHNEFITEYQRLVDDIVAIRLTNDYDSKLFNLREFFIKYRKIKKINSEFYRKWLHNVSKFPNFLPSGKYNGNNSLIYSSGKDWNGNTIIELEKDINELKYKCLFCKFRVIKL